MATDVKGWVRKHQGLVLALEVMELVLKVFVELFLLVIKTTMADGVE